MVRFISCPRSIVVFLSLAAAVWLWNPIVFISEDSYFYAVVARNLALTGVQSFWGVEPTNGVHPLWLYLLAGYDWIVARFSPDLLYHPAFGVPLVVALIAIGSANLLVVAERARLPRSLLIFPQLLFLTVFGLLYSEAHTAFCAHTFLLRAVSAEEDDSRSRPIVVGLSAAAVLLARLDNVFYVVAFMGWYAMRRRSPRTVLTMAVACAIPASCYIASNAWFFGSVVPVSGYLKSTFPVPHLRGLAESPGGLVLMFSGYSVPFGWIPVVFGAALAIAAPLLRVRLTGIQTMFYPLLAGTLGHALYTGFFTLGFTFWYWYYLLPIVLFAWTASCIFSLVGSRVGEVCRISSGLRLDRVVSFAAVAALVFALGATRTGFPSERKLTGLTTLRVVREAGITDATLFVSEWPGTLAFFTHNRVIAADMLTSNRRLVKLVTGAPNGADALFAEAQRLGTPIDYVIFNGGLFLLPYPDLQSLEYRDPRMVEVAVQRSVGRLQLGPSTVQRDGIFIWRAPR